MKNGSLKNAKPCRKMDELTEEERTHLRDVGTENRKNTDSNANRYFRDGCCIGK